MKAKFELKTHAGTYYGNSFWQIVTEVLKHRLYHLIHDGKWMD